MTPVGRYLPLPLLDTPPISSARSGQNGGEFDHTQAVYELDRAIDFGSVGDLAAWAERWGRGAMDALNEAHHEIDRLDAQQFEPDDVDTSSADAALDELTKDFDAYVRDPSPDQEEMVREGLKEVGKELNRL